MPASVVSFFEQPPAFVEIFGYALVALVALEMVVGKTRLDLRGKSFMRMHVTIAWSIGALLGVHGLIGLAHALAGTLARR